MLAGVWICGGIMSFDNPSMRRVRVEHVKAGQIELAEREAHHARVVLRLGIGGEVEVFDAEGNSAVGRIAACDGKRVVVRVERIDPSRGGEFEWWVASAVPKAARGDWMVEKLSELGVRGFVPLITERSVVSAEGKNKRERWERLASEAAKQSKRRGVMKIGEVSEVGKFVRELKSLAWYLTPDESGKNIAEAVAEISGEKKIQKLTLLIGPEGGWTDAEVGMFDGAGLTGVRMGGTILRVETAAVAAAAIVAAMVAPILE
jgi:16S rRNA (uracil1498-N3)-methyltransferase